MRTANRVWTIVVVTIMIAAGLGSGIIWEIVSQRGGATNTAPNDGNGITYGIAYQAVNLSLQGLAGGPWELISASGIASALPIAPLPATNMSGAASVNETVRLCGLIPGVTAWNMTLGPVFTGSLDSGAAPFWSLAFRNDSGAITYATNDEGVVRVYPPSSSLQACAEAAGLTSASPVTPMPDTPIVARAAFADAGKNFAAGNSPLAEFYVIGASQQVNLDVGPFWAVNYFRCDMAGVAGINNYTAVGVLPNGTPWFVDRGWLTCTVPYTYTFLFDPFSINVSGNPDESTYVSIPFQVTFPVGASHTVVYDGEGLQPWMTDIRLTNSTGQSLPPANPSCRAWVPDITDCPANSSGWFAVLLSANGEWLDSFPGVSTSDNWSYPNVLLVSHERLVVVLPNSWNATGDVLTIGNSSSDPIVDGSTTL